MLSSSGGLPGTARRAVLTDTRETADVALRDRPIGTVASRNPGLDRGWRGFLIRTDALCTTVLVSLRHGNRTRGVHAAGRGGRAGIVSQESARSPIP
jgi:hypothetical protein